VAHDGASAIVAAREFKPQIVLLDIGLPEIDGYQVARRLRSEGNDHRDVRIVALTGYRLPDRGGASEQTDFDEYLLKPVSMNVLNGVLQRYHRSRS
jgi:CheY-like chemotaxis protein